MHTLERRDVEKTEVFITKNILTTYQQHCLNIYQRSNGDNSLIDGHPHNKSLCVKYTNSRQMEHAYLTEWYSSRYNEKGGVQSLLNRL